MSTLLSRRGYNLRTIGDAKSAQLALYEYIERYVAHNVSNAACDVKSKEVKQIDGNIFVSYCMSIRIFAHISLNFQCNLRFTMDQRLLIQLEIFIKISLTTFAIA